MAYLGVPQSKLENLTTNVQIVNLGASFDGTTVTFNLQDSRGDAVSAIHERALLVVLGGITQKPGVDYTTSGNTITFTTAPVSNLTIHIRKLYGVQRIIGVNDGVISPVKLSTGGPVWNSSGNVTISGDLNVTGAFNSGGNGLFWEDNERANFGSDNDLKIYHDGGTAHIDNDLGQIRMRTASDMLFYYEGSGGTEDYAKFLQNGAVELYYDGTKKFETSSDGIKVHEDTDKVIEFSGAITQLGSIPGIQSTNTAGSGLRGLGLRGSEIKIATGSNVRLNILSSGKIGIGTDTTTAKLEISDAIGTTGEEVLLKLQGRATKNVYLDINADANRRGVIRFKSAGTDKWSIGRGDSDELSDSSFFIATGNSGGNTAKLVIDSDGDVGIGTSSPGSKLHVKGVIRLDGVSTPFNGNFSKIYQNSSSSVDYGLQLRHYQGDTDSVDASITIGGNGSTREDNIVFYKSDGGGGSVETVRIDEQGHVGIGTNNPNSALSIETNIDYSVDGTEFDDNASIFLVNDHRGSNVYSYSESAIVLAGRNSGGSTKRTTITGGGSGIGFFVTENQDLLDVPAARFTGNGRLLLGAQTPRVYSTTVNPFLQIEGTEYHNAALSIARNSNDAFGSYLILAKSRGTSLGGITKLEDDDIISEIRFAGADDVDMSNIASVIRCKVDGSVSNNTLPGLIQFQTNQGSGLIDRLSISSGGQILTAGAQTVPLASTGGIDLCSGLYSVVIGGNSGGGSDNTTRTNSTNKEGRITSAPHTNSEEPVSIATVFNRSSENLLYFGGGSSLVNAATKIGFYTASNTTTTGGTERLHITPGGSIGIGTNTPQAKLHVADGDLWISSDVSTSGNGKPTIFFSEAAPSSSSYSMFIEYDGDGQSNENNRLTIGTTSVTVSQFFIDGKMRLGGGSGRPSGHLDVQGDDGLFIKTATNNPTNGAYLRFSDHQSDNFTQFGWIKYKHSDGSIYSGSNDGFIIGGSEANTIVKIDGQFVVNETDAQVFLNATRGTGHVWKVNSSGTNAQSFELYDGSGSQRAFLYGSQGAADAYKGWTFYTNGTTDRLRIDNNGNVGIGINNPTAKLHVNGDLKTNDLILSNLDNPTGGNEVDGTRGHWCIQEGEDDLYILNRLNGKRYKMSLTEV